MDYDTFRESYSPQLYLSQVPEKYWKSLYRKLSGQILDAGNAFQIMQIEHVNDNKESIFLWKVEVIAESGISLEDPDHIYLIDHAWTFTLENAYEQLISIPKLLQRLSNLMEVGDDGPLECVAKKVMSEMWRYCQTYSLATATFGSDSSMPVWYILDEFGSRIQHSNDFSCRIVPLIYDGAGYSILFPIREMEKGDELTRDFVEGCKADDLVRRAKLIPWIHSDITDISYQPPEVDESFYTQARKNETLPVPELKMLPLPETISLYCEFEDIRTFLSHPRFKLVEDKEEAHIWMPHGHFKDYEWLSTTHPGVYLAQFPYEHVLTCKDLMAEVSRSWACQLRDIHAPLDVDRAYVLDLLIPAWLAPTFNLQTQLSQFASYFQAREKLGLDNTWICKPWNLARAMDSHVTNNLNQIVRLQESGPKIACKYLEDPVLYFREDLNAWVKFDLRYNVILRSVKPLKLYVMDVFWLRFANREFSLADFHDYEKHFTVMNYRDNAALKMVHHYDFIPAFESMYPEWKWIDIESQIHKSLRELFTAASSNPPPKGLCHSPQSSAQYGVDLMIRWRHHPDGTKTIQPTLLEVNFRPDNKRACKYHPDTYNHFFSAMFLDDIEGLPIKEI